MPLNVRTVTHGVYCWDLECPNRNFYTTSVPGFLQLTSYKHASSLPYTVYPWHSLAVVVSILSGDLSRWKLLLCLCGLSQDFSTWTLLTFGARQVFVVAAWCFPVHCRMYNILYSLDASSISPHPQPRQLGQTKGSADIAKCLLEGKITSGRGPGVYNNPVFLAFLRFPIKGCFKLLQRRGKS